jgi:transcriptional regulator with XRE-family HTH domain
MSTKSNAISRKEHLNIDEIAKTLTLLMDRRKISSEVLCQATGLSVTIINNIKRGVGNPTIGTLSTLASFFNVPISTLIGSIGGETKGQVVIVDIFDLRNIHLPDKRPVLKHMLEEPNDIEQNSLFGVMLNNNTLSPYYEKGCIFIASKYPRFVNGDMIILRLKDEVNLIKRCFFQDGLYYLQDLMPNKPAENYETEDINIIGRVTHIHQKMD